MAQGYSNKYIWIHRWPIELHKGVPRENDGTAKFTICWNATPKFAAPWSQQQLGHGHTRGWRCHRLIIGTIQIIHWQLLRWIWPSDDFFAIFWMFSFYFASHKQWSKPFPPPPKNSPIRWIWIQVDHNTPAWMICIRQQWKAKMIWTRIWWFLSAKITSPTMSYDERTETNMQRENITAQRGMRQRRVWYANKADWKWFPKIYFNSQNQPAGVPPGQQQLPSSPPPGSYNTNPTPGPFNNQFPSDIDRRRADFRSRMDDDLNGGQKTGPKNRYGMT